MFYRSNHSVITHICTTSTSYHLTVYYSLWELDGHQLSGTEYHIRPSHIALLEDSKTPHQRTIRHVSFSPDGLFMSSCGFDGQTNIYKRSNLQEASQSFMYSHLTTLEGHENEVKHNAWSMRSGSSGKAQAYLLATCGRDKAIWIWELSRSSIGDNDEDLDLQTDCLAVLQEHTQDVKQVLWHPYIPSFLFSSSSDDTIRLWKEASSNATDEAFAVDPDSSKGTDDDPAPGDWFLFKTLVKHTSIVWSIDISKHDRGRWLVSVSADGSVCIWDGSVNWSCVYYMPNITLFSQPLYTVTWCPQTLINPSLKLIAMAGGDDTIYIYQLNDQVPTNVTLLLMHKQANAHQGDILHLAFAAMNGNFPLLISAGDDQSINAWRIQSN